MLGSVAELSPVGLEESIAKAAYAEGFALVGFARLRRLENREGFYARWLAEGRQGGMGYLAREPERRFDPNRLDPRLRSVVSLGYPYRAPSAPILNWGTELRGRIAAYALGPDYHDVVMNKAHAVAAAIASACPSAVTRAYVDTGPVFEREWGSEASIGWFGKNTNLLNRDRGSYFFLSEIFTDVVFDSNREPYGDYCGTCRRCLDLCPTNALSEGYLMEPRFCISYLTIENRGAIPAELRSKLGMWIFGCDICQEVCPWNEEGSRDGAEELAPYLPELLAMDEDAFRRRYGRSAVRRAKRRGLLRNVAVALGNSGNPDSATPLARSLESEPEPLVRAHAAWALGSLGSAAAIRALERQLVREIDAEVQSEIKSALERGRG